MQIRQLRPIPTLIAVTVISLVCLGEAMGLFQRFEWITYDWRVRQAASSRNQAVSPHLGAVFIDDESIQIVNEAYGFTYPWPRQLHGKIVRELAAQKAKAIGFDVLFTELHPPAENTDITVSDTEVLSSDEFFAEELKRAGNTVLAVARPYDVQGVGGQNDGVLFPAPLFRTNAWAIGSIDAKLDSGGTLRRVRPYIVSNGKRIWTMGIVLAARELKLDLENPVILDDRIVLSNYKGETRTIPIDEQGYFYIPWRISWNDPRLMTLNSVIMMNLDNLRQAGDTNKHEEYLSEIRAEGLTKLVGNQPFRNRLVVIGSVGQGNNISDKGATPLATDTFLVSKHWNVANSMLLNQFIVKSSILLNVTLIFLLGLLAAILTWEERILTASLLISLVIVAYVVFCDLLFIYTGYWLPIVSPAGGALFLTHVILVTHRAIFEQAQQRRIKGIFSKVVSPDIVSELLKSENISFGGERRDVTVYFADVRGFTEMTDTVGNRVEEYVRKHNLVGEQAKVYYDKAAKETLDTVNTYLAAIADVIKKNDGTLDKYIGDCVMAFWGAPTLNEKHALCSVQAAIESQRAIYQLNKQRAAENERRKKENIALEAAGREPLDMLPEMMLGSGINTGWVTVGLMGSDSHILNFTVFGREVNLASRLEGVSGRARIIIGQQTHAHLLRDDPKLAASCIALDPVPVKGFRAPVQIYEVPWKTPEMLEADKAPTPSNSPQSVKA